MGMDKVFCKKNDMSDHCFDEVRRRICARQIYLPFSKSNQRVELFTHRAHRRHAEASHGM